VAQWLKSDHFPDPPIQ